MSTVGASTHTAFHIRVVDELVMTMKTEESMTAVEAKQAR